MMHADNESHQTKLNFTKIGPVAALVALVCIVASLIFIFAPPSRDAMLGSYLYGLLFWGSVAIGCFGLTVLHNLVRGYWALPLVRLFEAGGGVLSLALILVLFVPLLFFLPEIYHWADTHHVHGDAVLEHKAAYLNVPFFIIRLVGYFLIWILLAAFLRRSALRQEQSLDFKEEQKRINYSAPGLIAFFITVTFAATDWAMSLDPHWYSTMWGLLWAVNAGIGGLTLCTIFFATNADKAPYNGIITTKLLNDIGNMLFVLTMLWGYFNLSQLLIIWNGNIPETAKYYAVRGHLGWNVVGMMTMVGQFFVPFFSLLAPRTKKTPKWLARIAGWMFVMLLVDVYIKVVPMLPGHRNFMPTFYDVLALVGIGAVWLFAFATQVRKAALLPRYDNRLQEAVHHAH